jgi:hypothetical protein
MHVIICWPHLVYWHSPSFANTTSSCYHLHKVIITMFKFIGCVILLFLSSIFSFLFLNKISFMISFFIYLKLHWWWEERQRIYFFTCVFWSSLVSKVTTIEIALLWPHFNMHHNCHGIWIQKWKGSSLSCQKNMNLSLFKTNFWH